MKVGCIALGWILALLGARAYAQGTATETLGFQINVEPVFSVETVSEEAGEVELGPILPGEAPPSKQVRILIHTNTGQPYRVIQKVDQLPVSELGVEFPAQELQFAVSDGIRGGQSQVGGFQPLTPGVTFLFSSTPQGQADQFTITYRSPSQQVIPAGIYRARLAIEGELQ